MFSPFPPNHRFPPSFFHPGTSVSKTVLLSIVILQRQFLVFYQPCLQSAYLPSTLPYFLQCLFILKFLQLPKQCIHYRHTNKISIFSFGLSHNLTLFDLLPLHLHQHLIFFSDFHVSLLIFLLKLLSLYLPWSSHTILSSCLNSSDSLDPELLFLFPLSLTQLCSSFRQTRFTH